MPLATLAPLAQVPGVSFHSVQKGDAIAQAAGLPAGFKVANHSQALRDFSDTAGLVDNLDLVITVDTSVAHLAGAMGKPVWTMLAYSPDWRWQLSCADSPWYPSMRLFRQERPCDWTPVVTQIAAALRQAAGHG
jgi:ADP-heptose:LPS heptosyltransferase